MTRLADDLRGLFPSVNDILAAAIILATYVIRLVATTTPTRPPWWLSVMTDFILPGLAAAWLFVIAMYAAYVALGEP